MVLYPFLYFPERSDNHNKMPTLPAREVQSRWWAVRGRRRREGMARVAKGPKVHIVGGSTFDLCNTPAYWATVRDAQGVHVYGITLSASSCGQSGAQRGRRLRSQSG